MGSLRGSLIIVKQRTLGIRFLSSSFVPQPWKPLLWNQWVDFTPYIHWPGSSRFLGLIQDVRLREKEHWQIPSNKYSMHQKDNGKPGRVGNNLKSEVRAIALKYFHIERLPTVFLWNGASASVLHLSQKENHAERSVTCPESISPRAWFPLLPSQYRLWWFSSQVCLDSGALHMVITHQ